MRSLAQHMAPPEPDDDFIVRLHREHDAALRKYLKTLLHSIADADDVAQETYARIHRLPHPKDLADSRAWLFFIAVRTARTYLKRKRRASTVPLDTESGEVADEAPLPEAISIFRDAMQQLEKIARELPERQREVFFRYRFSGESREDIAAQLGISLNTVDQHLWKAKAYCQERLEALGLGVQGGDSP